MECHILTWCTVNTYNVMYILYSIMSRTVEYRMSHTVLYSEHEFTYVLWSAVLPLYQNNYMILGNYPLVYKKYEDDESLYSTHNVTYCTSHVRTHTVPYIQDHILHHTLKDTYCTIRTRTHTVPYTQGHILYHTRKTTYCTTHTRTHTVPYTQGHILYSTRCMVLPYQHCIMTL